jgi:hypothetical protein
MDNYNQNIRIPENNVKPQESFSTMNNANLCPSHEEDPRILKQREQIQNELNNLSYQRDIPQSQTVSSFPQEKGSQNDSFQSQIERSYMDTQQAKLTYQDHFEHTQEMTHDESHQANGKGERKLPKRLEALKQKYEEHLEKQQRMNPHRKDKDTGKAKQSKKPVTNTQITGAGYKLLNIGGKLRPVHITTVEVKNHANHTHENPQLKNHFSHDENRQISSPIPPHEEDPRLKPRLSHEEDPRLKPRLSHEEDLISMNNAATPINNIIREPNECNDANCQALHPSYDKSSKMEARKLPERYAKEIENENKTKAIKSVHNFTELRKFKTLENLKPGTDLSGATMSDLRKIQIEQRRKEYADSIKKQSPEKESKIQEILNNEKMSKFSKTLAIRNLANGRRKSVSTSQNA